MQLLRDSQLQFERVVWNIYASEVDLNGFDGNNNLVGAVYQSGYLTIKDFDGKYYRLGIPMARWGRFYRFLVLVYARSHHR